MLQVLQVPEACYRCTLRGGHTAQRTLCISIVSDVRPHAHVMDVATGQHLYADKARLFGGWRQSRARTGVALPLGLIEKTVRLLEGCHL